MKEKLRGIGLTLAAAAAYWLIQNIVAQLCYYGYAMVWARSHDPTDREAFAAAIQLFQERYGLYMLLAAAVPCILLALGFMRSSGLRGRFAPPNAAWAGLPILCGLALNVLVSCLLSALPFPESALETNQVLESILTGGHPALAFAVTGLVVPLAEELLFRGVCYGALRRVFPARVAIVAQALLFALFHGNPVQIIGVFPVALLLGLSYEWSGTLFAPLLMHMAFNCANALLALIPDTEAGRRLFVVVVLPVSAVTAALSIWGMRNRGQRTEDREQTGDGGQ
ncbi:MAG: CPBP family intramembrane metalloprotease [Oscillospiraceae bacterium]|nr:CPBP family intramembrane metalloprotease [Oscillospiraceae bacterium]